MFLSLFFFSSFHSFFFSLSFFIAFVRKCTKFFVLVMQKLRNFTSFLRSVRAYSLNRILVSFEIVNPEFGRVRRYIPGNNETNSSYISSCSPFSSIMRGSSLHEEYESHWVGSTFVIFLNGLSFGIKLGRET